MKENGKNKNRFKMFVALYVVTSVLFIMYLLFISDHTLSTHRDLNRKISNLEERITNTKNQIGNIYTYEQLSSDSSLLEKYGREQMNMHKTNEDVFVIIHE